jgi:hypothetical protein
MKYYILLILFLLAISCNKDSNIDKKHLPQEKSKYITFSYKNIMYIIPHSGLILRSAHSKDSENIELIPFNTGVECPMRTDEEYKVDNKSNYWYKCNYKNKTGWLFGSYLSQELNFVNNKTNYFVSSENGHADIKFTLYKNNTFIIKLIIFSDPKDKIINYNGTWELKDNNILLNFSSDKYNPKDLFFFNSKKMPENNNIDFINDKSFLYRINDSTLYIWGVLCYIKNQE